MTGRLGRRNLLRRVELLVERRHKIVHDGDYNRRRQLRSIDPNRTVGRMKDLHAFVEAAENFLEEAL